MGGIEMVNIRRNYSAEEKARIALEALKETMTIAELSSKYGVHASPRLEHGKNV